MIVTEGYIGSKNGSGVMQAIINNVPYHKRYFELFGGNATLFFSKIACEYSYISEIDARQADKLKSSVQAMENVVVKNVSALSVLPIMDFNENDFIYLDPPYNRESRRSAKRLYKHDMIDDGDHEQMLSTVQDLKANVMISCRHNKLYDQVLKHWRKISISTADRGGAVEELIYMNYDEPEFLHQYDQLGTDCWDRQRIKRKLRSLMMKLYVLPAHERNCIINELIENNCTAATHFLSVRSGELLLPQTVKNLHKHGTYTH
jgi:DNA adenine methylase